MLIEHRRERGSIGFTIPEADITLNKDGTIASVKKSSRTLAHQLIEEFMLAANETVAQHLAAEKMHLLYRIHEQPDEEKLINFLEFAKSLAIEIPKEPDRPTLYNRIIESVKDSPHEYIVNTLLLRTMQQARYSPENKGHFGLALEKYTHFTSPIRRYPDLIVHRLLCGLIERKKDGGSRCKIKTGPIVCLKENGLHLSERERTAIAR